LMPVMGCSPALTAVSSALKADIVAKG
jgi:hypothetical protein